MAVSQKQLQRQAATRQRWVHEKIMPHERALRIRLRHLGCPTADVEEVVQETYLRLLRLERISHIHDPRSYFFQAARSVLLGRVRRRKVVQFVPMPEALEASLTCAMPLPDRVVADRQTMELFDRGLAALPQRMRRIVELRRVEGKSVRETAALLGVSESLVDKQACDALVQLAEACGWPQRRRLRAGK